MTTKTVYGNGAFSRNENGFAMFLDQVGHDSGLGNKRFVARNFLIDERVPDVRAASYEASGAVAQHASFKAWNGTHNDYLSRWIFLNQPLNGPPRIVDRNNETTCPETFRVTYDSPDFGAADIGFDLLRVVEADRIARRADVVLDDLLGWAELAVSNPAANTLENQLLDAALDRWAKRLDLRPVYAAFWEDLKTLFGTEPTKDPVGWADALRDRLGLLHFDPTTKQSPIRMFVFRYPVGDLPTLRRTRDMRLIAVPTVLDGYLSEAFCPAPKGEPFGLMVDLAASLESPRREIVHPFIPLGSKHLFRVGTVAAPVPRDIGEARAAHLLYLREQNGWRDYAVGTDGDLL